MADDLGWGGGGADAKAAGEGEEEEEGLDVDIDSDDEKRGRGKKVRSSNRCLTCRHGFWVSGCSWETWTDRRVPGSVQLKG